MNRQSHCEVLRLIQKAQLETEIRSQHHWEEFLAQWRNLQHESALARFRDLIRSSRYTHPSEAEVVLGYYRSQHEDHDRRRDELFLQLINVSFQNLDTKFVADIHAKLMAVQEKEASDAQVLCAQLRQINETLFLDLKNDTEELRHELHGFGALRPRPPWRSLTASLDAMLRDDSLLELFRLGGHLKTDFEDALKLLSSRGLEYTTQLVEIKKKLQVIQGGFSLKTVLESKGRGSLLDRMRNHCKC